ncbi:oligosaccharide flippase family protein [Zooshikella harenae]|uniref:Polysaccharide biosynthesis C-terminal domain-containing protein n=1 Tax=Zooshikella harenae TaxID=2827238 RepID=A0ABS5ZHJ2_9GAMM|nr:polysaccharide biosynthesis C-terminal domain-containing protein [Zooshikella harenae]MBU2712756.1 polysaccharide biosynthesis C-terminal domain-containing protein [Zooshikella harenae]
MKQRTRKQLLDEISQSFIAKVVSIIVRVLRVALIARILGPFDRGIFALLNSIVEITFAAGNCGYSTALAYHVSHRSLPLKAMLGSLTSFSIVFGLLFASFAMIILGAINFWQGERAILESYTYVMVLLIVFLLWINGLLRVLNALNKITSLNIIRVLESFIPLVIFLLAWWLLPITPFNAAVLSGITTLILLVTLAISLLKRYEPGHWPLFNKQTHRKLIGYGARGHFEGVFRFLLLRQDFLIVGLLLGAEPLGYYAMASSAAELMLVMPEALTTPLLSFFMGPDAARNKDVTPLALRLTNSIMFFGALALVFFGYWLIVLLFGQAYSSAYEPMIFLLPGIIGLSFCSIIRLDLLGKNRPGAVSVVAACACAVNLIANLLLIPEFGLVGAAISSSVAYLLAAVLLFRLYQQTHPLHWTLVCWLQRDDWQKVGGWIQEWIIKRKK